MRAGRLADRVTLQSATVTRGELGGQVQTWTSVATVWAEVSDLSGRQLFAAQAAGNAVTKAVLIRYRSGVTADMRVLLPSGQTARISHIKETRKRWLELFCEVING